MQMKTFDTHTRQGVPVAGQVTNQIEVIENREENFHGIRYKGRLTMDAAVLGFADGYVGIMCIPNDQIAIPQLFFESDLNDSNSFIIAVEPWQTVISVVGRRDNYGSTHDFDFSPKTSRSCMKGGKIVGFVSCITGSVDGITVSAILSLFRTNT